MKKMFFFALAAAGMLTAYSNEELSVEMASRTYLNSRFVSALLRLRFRPVVLVP